jgi:phytanoyl-CoA hydroxylase
MSDLRQRYDRDGFVVVPGAVPRAVIDRWREQLSTLELTPNGLVPVEPWHEHGALSWLASELLGTEAQGFGATFVVKPPASPWHVSWHQDGEPWLRQWGIRQAVTIWVALDAAGPHNGGLRIIPGSHRQPLRALEPVDDDVDVFGWASPAHEVDESHTVDVELEAGDVSAHHPATMHASGPNRSSEPRRALSLRYRATSTVHPHHASSPVALP